MPLVGLGQLGASDVLVGQCPCKHLGLPSSFRHYQEDCSGTSFWIMSVGLAACPADGGLTLLNMVNWALVISTGRLYANMEFL